MARVQVARHSRSLSDVLPTKLAEEMRRAAVNPNDGAVQTYGGTAALISYGDSRRWAINLLWDMDTLDFWEKVKLVCVQSVNHYGKEYLVEHLDSSALCFLTLLQNDVRNCHWSAK